MDDSMLSNTRPNEIFADILATHEIKLETAASIMGYGLAHVARFKLCEAVIPIDAWGRLLQATRDPRIAALLGAHYFDCSGQPPAAGNGGAIAARSEPPEELKDVLPRMLDALRELAECAKFVNDIVQDGTVDASDDLAMNKLILHSKQARDLIGRTERSLVARREASK